MTKSEHKLSFENFMYLKWTFFFYYNLILFSENNYKNQAQMFYQNDQSHSLALHTVTPLGSAVTYPEGFSERYTGMGAQILASKKGYV